MVTYSDIARQMIGSVSAARLAVKKFQLKPVSTGSGHGHAWHLFDAGQVRAMVAALKKNPPRRGRPPKAQP